MTRPLHILQVVEATFDGVGRHVLDLSAHLIANGHRVDLVWSPDRAERRFRERVTELGFAEMLELSPGSGSWRGLPAVFRELATFVSQHGPYDVIHGHSSRGGAWARMIPTSAIRVYTPNALITQAPEIGEGRRRMFSIIERLMSFRTDGLICVSPEESMHASAIGLRPKNTLFIPNGIELGGLPSREQARKRLGIPDDELVFGSVGRLASQKGHDRLLAAFALHVDDGGEGSLVIVGEGPEAGNLRQQARELGIEERVRFLGRRPGQMAMRAFDVFALASRYEGFPYVLLEAMWAGLPVLISDRASVSAIIDSGVNGVVAPPTAEAFARAMRELASSPTVRSDLASRAVDSVQAFSISEMAGRTEKFYLQLLDETA